MLAKHLIELNYKLYHRRRRRLPRPIQEIKRLNLNRGRMRK